MPTVKRSEQSFKLCTLAIACDDKESQGRKVKVARNVTVRSLAWLRIHLRPCSCGSIINGHLWAGVNVDADDNDDDDDDDNYCDVDIVFSAEVTESTG